MNRTAQVDFSAWLQQASFRRGVVFGSILLLALAAFEVFNFSTTDFALTDLLGSELKFLGIRWATILSIAFCGIDFAGIARLFTPEQGADEPREVWYLFGAWVLAAAMNAMLTWWGVAVAVRTHPVAGSAVLDSTLLLKVVPIFVAAMVWLTRILIIGTFAMAGDRLFSLAEAESTARRPQQQRPARVSQRQVERRPTAPRPAPRPTPAYHPVGMSAAAQREEPSPAPWR